MHAIIKLYFSKNREKISFFQILKVHAIKTLKSLKNFLSACTCIFSAYTRWQDCMVGMLRKYCNDKVAGTLLDYIDDISGQLTKNVCPRDVYDWHNRMCRRLLPPMWTTAKGAKSRSYLSFLFSYYCPNVGYGITDWFARLLYR